MIYNAHMWFVALNSRAARVLIALVIPGHLIFMYTISYMKAGHTSITWTFALFYLTAALLQVSLFGKIHDAYYKKTHLHLCKLIYVQGKLKSNLFVES